MDVGLPGRPAADPPSLSVVVATHNRLPLVARLLEQLGRQTLAPEEFEVVVVDDGSETPVEAALRELRLPYACRVLRQPQAGPAAARHRGILEARGPLLVIVDDDMQVPAHFLAAHRDSHAAAPGVVIGRMRADPGLADMPLFERFHAEMLDRFVADVGAGRAVLRGTHLYTGNTSFPRAVYLAVGGFDLSLDRSEDIELGLRLERAGLELAFSESAYSVHSSDHRELGPWLRRAFRYGVCDHRISRKHPDALEANPWRIYFSMNPLARPALLAALCFPRLGWLLGRAAMASAQALDRASLRRLALSGTALVYAVEYYRGVRAEAGLRAALRERRAYARGMRAPGDAGRGSAASGRSPRTS
jgi:GT2 family glycosyltransferase